MVMRVCTGIGAPRCLDEQLAWQLYDEHGYRPRETRPCLTAPSGAAERAQRGVSRHRLLGLLRRRPR
jgi:hypothetical protein